MDSDALTHTAMPEDIHDSNSVYEASDEENDNVVWGHDTYELGRSSGQDLCLRSIVYHKDDPDHDFTLMVKNPKYAGTLILYAENYMSWRNPGLQPIGGGSAVIRPMAHPKGMANTAGVYVAGIVTGYSPATGGFVDLGKDEKLAIDLCFYNILNILRDHNDIHNVVFACDSGNHNLFGTSIFKVSEAAINYISRKLFTDLLMHVYQQDYKIPSPVSIERVCKNILDKIGTLLHSHHMWNIRASDLEKELERQQAHVPQSIASKVKEMLSEGKKRKRNFDVPISDWNKASPPKAGSTK